MTIVRHPTLDVEHDVPKSKLAEWIAAGWITDESDLVIETDAGQLAPIKPKLKPKK